MSNNIPINCWGHDHWSTFAYVETRIVDHAGTIERRHMRCNTSLHPFFAHEGSSARSPSPTRLATGDVSPHDDWSCLDDAEAEGLIQNVGSGLHRRYTLTDKGDHAMSLSRYSVSFLRQLRDTGTIARWVAVGPDGRVCEPLRGPAP